MHIAWADLGLVVAVGLLLGAGIVALYAVGVRLLPDTAGPQSPVDTSSSLDDNSSRRAKSARWAAAGLCFAVCGAAVAYGVSTLL